MYALSLEKARFSMMGKLLLHFILTGFLTSVFAEKVNLEVFASRLDSIPIGVVDFISKNEETLVADQPWKVVANDLDLCGRFTVTARASFDSAGFASHNVRIVIQGDYTITGTSVEVTFTVIDALSLDTLFQKVYSVGREALRDCSHQFCNELFAMLFGDPGLFESHVLHIRTEEGKKNISLMDFDGMNLRILTSSKVMHLFPAFLDSSTMVYTSYQRGKPDIFRSPIGGSKPTVIAASRGIQVSPAVSPIDNTIVYASSKGGSLDIYACDPDGTNVRQLTTSGGVETAPCWSPNGYQISFTSDKSGNPQIYVMDADGSNQRRITYKTKYCDSPAWSPKGDLIAFTSMLPSGKLEIWTVSPDGNNEVQVTSISGHNEYPTWSPDGSLIGFIHRQGDRSDFCVMKPDGSRVRFVTRTGNVIMPDWGK